MKPKLADTSFEYLANCPSTGNIQSCLPRTSSLHCLQSQVFEGQIKPEIPAQAARNTSSSPRLGKGCLFAGCSLWGGATQAFSLPSGFTEALLNSTQALTLFCSQLFLIYIILVICFIAQAQTTGTQTPEWIISSQGKDEVS